MVPVVLAKLLRPLGLYGGLEELETLSNPPGRARVSAEGSTSRPVPLRAMAPDPPPSLRPLPAPGGDPLTLLHGIIIGGLHQPKGSLQAALGPQDEPSPEPAPTSALWHGGEGPAEGSQLGGRGENEDLNVLSAGSQFGKRQAGGGPSVGDPILHDRPLEAIRPFEQPDAQGSFEAIQKGQNPGPGPVQGGLHPDHPLRKTRMYLNPLR